MREGLGSQSSSMGITVYRSRAELEEVREFWLGAQHHPNSDFEHFLLVCELRPEVAGPCVLAAWRDGRCRALLVGRMERTTLRPRIGYLSLPGVPATVVTIVHAGVLGELDEPAAKEVVLALFGLLRSDEADLATVNALPEQELLWSALNSQPTLLARSTQPRWAIHRELGLASSPGFLLGKMRSKHRAWIRRKEKDLEVAFPSRVRWLWHCRITATDSLCEQMEIVAKRTYQRGLGAGFVNNEETRRRMALFASRGQLRALILEIDGSPKAFWTGEVYGGVFHSSATGYTPEVRGFEVGTLMFLRMVDELIRERITRLDLGLGDAQYKERFADRSWREGTIHIFAPTFKGWLLLVMFTGSERLDRAIRNLVGRLGLVDQLKKMWRRTLIPGGLRRE